MAFDVGTPVLSMYEKSAKVVIAWQSKQNINPRMMMKRLGKGSVRVRKPSCSTLGDSYGCGSESTPGPVSSCIVICPSRRLGGAHAPIVDVGHGNVSTNERIYVSPGFGTGAIRIKSGDSDP